MLTKATIEELALVPEKAELIKGELVTMPPTGGDPGYAGDETFASLREYSKRTKRGRAVSDNKAFRVDLPNRDSFSPDAAFYFGPNPGMKFYEGAPVFAVEVRSENDYGREAEKRILAKIHDYFAAGTLVVRDVDLLSSDVIKSCRHTDPNNPVVFLKGEIADAEPAIPDWRMAVDDLFLPQDIEIEG